MKTLFSNTKVAVGKQSGSVTATGAGSIVDTKGYESIMFTILIEAVAAADGSNYLTFGIEEGDDGSALTDAVAITSPRLLGSLVINATSMANSAQKIGAVLGTKRYVRLTYTETSTFSGTFGAVALLGRPRHAPVS